MLPATERHILRDTPHFDLKTDKTFLPLERKDYLQGTIILLFSVQYLQLQSKRRALSFPKFYQLLTQAFDQRFLFVRFQDKKQRDNAVHHALNICTKQNMQLFKTASSNHW